MNTTVKEIADVFGADEACAAPSLRPGDVVRTKSGSVGVIVKAQTTVNGRTWEWHEFPLTEGQLSQTGYDHIEHGRPPQYALEFAGGGEKFAWWNAKEFSEVLQLGPFHD